jgi:uncharacterized protein (DUF2384 family)
MKLAIVQDVPRLARNLTAHGFQVQRVALGRGAAGRSQSVDVVVVADAGGARPGAEMFERLASRFPDTPCVYVSDHLATAAASRATDAGALLTTVRGAPRAIGRLERLLKPATREPQSGLVREFHDPRTGRLDAARMARVVGVPVSALARSVGVTASALSKRSTARAAQRGLREVEWAWASLLQMLGSNTAARAWLHAPHPDLGNQPPLSLLTEGSTTALADYVRSALSGQPT